MRILYLTDHSSVHNRRFLEKLVLAGYEVWFWNLTATQPPENGLPSGVQSIVSTSGIARSASPGQYRELLPQFQSLLKELQPALVHAGPIQSCGYLAALTDFHPLVLMSWGSDLLMQAERNSEWKQATELALQKADAFFCDCNTVRKKANSFRMSNPSLRLLLLGNGSQAKGIRSFVQAYGLNDAVSLLGPQPAEQLPMWFRAADAYVSCAKSDGTSISLLEAMATGLPVVVTDIPSNREWVAEPENGWLAPAGSPGAVADKMLQVANLTPPERKTMSERNQSVVAERADWDKNFPRLLEMYERLVG